MGNTTRARLRPVTILSLAVVLMLRHLQQRIETWKRPTTAKRIDENNKRIDDFAKRIDTLQTTLLEIKRLLIELARDKQQ
jgi:uncharacterized membrane protein YhiD involved in acid resistance